MIILFARPTAASVFLYAGESYRIMNAREPRPLYVELGRQRLLRASRIRPTTRSSGRPESLEGANADA